LAALFRSRTVPFPIRETIAPPLWLQASLAEFAVEFQDIEALDCPASHIQGEATKRLMPVLKAARQTIAEYFQATNNGLECAQAYAATIDAMLLGLNRLATDFAYPAAIPTVGEALQIIAVGGYGRGVLAPYSDIDLLFLLPYKQTARAEQITEFILYVLWDLSLKVGHAVRTVADCIELAHEDMVIRTSLLDMRPLAGDTNLGLDLARRLTRDVLPGTNKEFLAAKTAERETRLEKTGDSRYRLEPNVKEGKGGLRDVQLILWVAAHLWESGDPAELVRHKVFRAGEQRHLSKAENFLWTVRMHLHYQVGRAEERLTFDTQPQIAKALSYEDRAGALGVERFMKRYFQVAKEVGELSRLFLSAVEAELEAEWKFFVFPTVVEGFPLRQERLSLPDEKHFERQPLDLLRIFRVAQKTGRAIHPRAISAISRARPMITPAFRADPAAHALFLDIIAGEQPDETLSAMNEAGILSRFLPDWGRIVGQMQYDMYHVYTVDEHTLHVIANLAKLEQPELPLEFPLAASLVKQIRSRRELYIALLLHDIAKGRGGDHSILGEQVAFKFCRRFGLTQAETETIAWLVRWHLAMSDIALKRDLEDERTIADFARLVQSPERLRLLLILTYCDIHGVGPGRWNNWKAGLLSELFTRTSDLLSGSPSAQSSATRVAMAQEAARRALKKLSPKHVECFIEMGSAGYWLAYDAATHARHAHLIEEVAASPAAINVWTHVDTERSITEITVYADDAPGLFCTLAGSIAATGFSIVDAKISAIGQGKVLDVFSVQDASGDTGAVRDRREILLQNIERSRRGELNIAEDLSRRSNTFIRRTRALPAPPRVIIDNEASLTQTVIEVNGRDRPGLLYTLAATMVELGLHISSAKISTYGHRVVDVFYVHDGNNAKIGDAGGRLHHIYERLMQVLAEGVK
jgi:[protein-PII] uridylyltransferase